ncbi:MAG: hypothetical protein KC609_18910 [Myxococcales bacterium]|nr:hypothetical protein [Myxococcales bacterium]
MLELVRRFVKQPLPAYRNMQIVFNLLALQFLIPSMTYFFAPEQALGPLRQLAQLLGSTPYSVAEQSFVWRTLAAGNVFTLATLCFMLSWNIRRFAVLIPIFIVLKGFSSLGFLYVFAAETGQPLFLAIFFWDALAVFLVWFFGLRALQAVRREPTAELVPRLRFVEEPHGGAAGDR